MAEPHQGDERRQHSFEQLWRRLAEVGGAELTTSASIGFGARATVTSRGLRKGQRVIRYLQHGKEYARCYECCWEHYRNCYGTRIGMYSAAADLWASSCEGFCGLSRRELLRMIEENGGPEGLDLTGKNLSGLDLGTEAIIGELRSAKGGESEAYPPWVHVLDGEPRGLNLRLSLLHAALLWDTDLCGANLEGADLRHANLTRAKLSTVHAEGARMWMANLAGADLRGADLRRADLHSSNLREGDLSGANLESARLVKAFLYAANLRGVRMVGADVRDAYFKLANLQRADLRGLDLISAESLEGAYFHGAKLQGVDVTRRHLGEVVGEERDGEYLLAMDAYRALKNSFRDSGRYDDAGWAYVRERMMERMTHHPKLARRYYSASAVLTPLYGKNLAERGPGAHAQDRLGRPTAPTRRRGRRVEQVARWSYFYLKHTGKWLADWVVEAVCGYGESVVRVLATLLGLWFIAALWYRVCWGVIGSDGASVTGFGDYLLYSLAGLTTTSFDHLRPRLHVGWVPLVTAIEALLGIFLTGLLGFVLANRIRRS